MSGSTRRGRTLLVMTLALIGSIATPAAYAGGPAKFMMTTHVNGLTLEGQPLAWTDDQMLFLGRDGELYEFAPQSAKDSRKMGPAFRGYSIAEMRSRLRNEFDNRFEVSNTNHFVVVHPRGEWSAWANRLETLFRSFTHYMKVRGFSVQQPDVPLVAIVFRTQADYYRHAAASGTPLQPGTLGHYASQSNRIFLFDADGGGANWSTNAETIIHEATHQTAYNVGVHKRFTEQPRWVVEGLALMFEARGVWDGKSIYTVQDRINRLQLEAFRFYLEKRPDNVLVHLVASDKLFRLNTGIAYAEAWALSFFLSETQPQKYSRYLARVAAGESFGTYPAKARLADFVAIFGKDLELLDAQLRRFIAKL